MLMTSDQTNGKLTGNSERGDGSAMQIDKVRKKKETKKNVFSNTGVEKRSREVGLERNWLGLASRHLSTRFLRSVLRGGCGLRGGDGGVVANVVARDLIMLK
jgi:hypothetical protein